MSIEIDRRSDESAYIKVGDLTVYVEHSSAAPEHIHIWRNENEEIKKQAIKNKLGLVYTITGEPTLNKLYTKYMDMEICEKSVKSYVINLNKKKYKNLDWIS